MIAIVKQAGKILAKECDEFVGMIMKFCCSESSFRYLGCATTLFSHVGIHHLVTVITPWTWFSRFLRNVGNII
jgi:hypothetical protein